MTLCEYKDLFGEPGKGIREWRIFNLSIVDFIGAIILKLFCVETTLNKLLFNF